MTIEPATPTYRDLLKVRGFIRLYVAQILGRLGVAMLTLTLILFVILRYRSPALAGMTAFFAIFPGLLLSPLAGALLDRYGRARLIIADSLFAAASLALVALLALDHPLNVFLLLAIIGVSSLTRPLSETGARSLFPLLVPQPLWERANALDSSSYVSALLVGSPLAGLLVALYGPEIALLGVAAIFACAALAVVRLHKPATAPDRTQSVFADALSGLACVVHNATLRGLALTLGVFNLSWGLLSIAVPVLIFSRPHQGPAAVGFLWGALGAAGMLSALLVGRIKSLGRERHLMLVGTLLSALSIVVLPLAFSLFLVVACLVLYGLGNGPLDVGLITLRQRRTDPGMFGRAFAISMSLNWVGAPLGAALAGPLLGISLNLTLIVAAVFALLAAALALLAVPAHDQPQVT